MKSRILAPVILAVVAIQLAQAETVPETEQPSIISIGPTKSMGETQEILQARLKSQWEAVDSEKRKRIERFLLIDLGLSSTGTIFLDGSFLLTHDELIGKVDDRIFHFQQVDLFGGRLFWSALVNPSKDKALLLYRTGNEDGSLIEIR